MFKTNRYFNPVFVFDHFEFVDVLRIYIGTRWLGFKKSQGYFEFYLRLQTEILRESGKRTIKSFVV